MKSGTIVIMKDGSMRIIDPDRSMLPVVKKLDPTFEISEDPPPADFVPGFQILRNAFIGRMTHDELTAMDTAMLWAVHSAVISKKIPLQDKGDVCVLDLKVEIGNRILAECDLCGWSCKANRYEVAGKCGAESQVLCNGIFEHYAEEKVINPAWNLKLIWCPMRCAFCQAPENHAPEGEVISLGPETWETISKSNVCHSLEFVGGEPMVSCPGILSFLSIAPKDCSLPVDMNCSPYLGGIGINLMDGVVDVWMPDFNFSNDCARRLAGVEHYWETATEAISLMCGQEAKVIVRILVLPGGHVNCCNKKVLDWLSQYSNRIYISIMDQFLPLYEAHKHEDINKFPSKDEIQEVKFYAKKNGLRDVNEEPLGLFWR